MQGFGSIITRGCSKHCWFEYSGDGSHHGRPRYGEPWFIPQVLCVRLRSHICGSVQKQECSGTGAERKRGSGEEAFSGAVKQGKRVICPVRSSADYRRRIAVGTGSQWPDLKMQDCPFKTYFSFNCNASLGGISEDDGIIV
jgi:hypothetical protein